jgi:hypothetical protein
MWKPWKRNISWMRNQEIRFAFVSTMPNTVPARR